MRLIHGPVCYLHKTPLVTLMDLDCIIVGGGPAGLTAATYLRRLHRRVLVFDDGQSRARWIPESHNCPGFPSGVSGDQLLARLKAQAKTYGANLQLERVDSLLAVLGGWRVETQSAQWSAPTVLIATGVVDRLPELSSGNAEEALRSGLLRSCALCDGYEATDRRLAVVGPLAQATATAHYLSTFSADVTIVPIEDGTHPSNTPSTEGLAVLAPLKSVACIDGGWKVIDANDHVHWFDLVYAAMGAPPRSDLARQAAALVDAEGAVLTNEHMQTTRPGLYAVGDVVTDLNQIAVAFGHAAVAASAIHRALPETRRNRHLGESGRVS